MVAETAEVIAFIDAYPLHPGHTLVAPRRHVPNLYTLPRDLAGPLLETSARIARALKRAFAAEGVTLHQNNEPAGGQDVFHLHIHVIPRYAGDRAGLGAPRRRASLDEMEAAAAQLRDALLLDES